MGGRKERGWVRIGGRKERGWGWMREDGGRMGRGKKGEDGERAEDGIPRILRRSPSVASAD